DRLSNLFSFGGISLVGAIIWLRNRPYSRERLPDGQDRLTTDDGDSIDVEPEVVDLYENRSVRRDARDVVEPLRRGGIDRVRLRRNDQDLATVREADVEAFDVPEAIDAPIIVDDVVEMGLVVTSPEVDDPAGRKWRFSDGSQTFAAKVEDRAFIDRVLRGEE